MIAQYFFSLVACSNLNKAWMMLCVDPLNYVLLWNTRVSNLLNQPSNLLSWSVCWIFSDICSGNLSLFSLMQSFPINPSFFAKSLWKVISHVERSSRCFPFAAIHLNIFLKMLYKHFLENLSYLFLAMATKMVSHFISPKVNKQT